MTPKTQGPLDAVLDFLAGDEHSTRNAVAARLGVDREKGDPRSVQNLTSAARAFKRKCSSRRANLPDGFLDAYRELAALHNRNLDTPGALVPQGKLRDGFAYGPDGRSVVVAEGWKLDPYAPGGVAPKVGP